MEKKSSRINYKNPEGYADPTPYAAMKAIDGAETKAYHLFETIGHMARLAGFDIDGTIRFIDRAGRSHDGLELRRIKRAENKTEN